MSCLQAAIVICGFFISQFACMQLRINLFKEPIPYFIVILVFYIQIGYMRDIFFGTDLLHIAGPPVLCCEVFCYLGAILIIRDTLRGG